MSLEQVVKFLNKKQCFEGMTTGKCEHAACKEAREAKEVVKVAAELLELRE